MCVNLPRHLQFVNAGLHLNLQHPLSHFNETKIYLLVSQIHLKKKLSMAKPTNRKKQDELYQQLRECYWPFRRWPSQLLRNIPTTKISKLQCTNFPSLKWNQHRQSVLDDSADDAIIRTSVMTNIITQPYPSIQGALESLGFVISGLF